MKKICLFFALLILFISGSAVHTINKICYFPYDNSTISAGDSLEVFEEIQGEILDSIVPNHYIYKDSVDKVIRYSSCIKLYQMLGLVRDSAETNGKDSLFNYPIDRKIGKLNKKARILLDFILSDTTQYRREYYPIRQPFNPTFALEFIRNKQCVFYFISFGTGELAIADENGQFKFFLMRDSEIVKRWYRNVLEAKEQKQ